MIFQTYIVLSKLADSLKYLRPTISGYQDIEIGVCGKIEYLEKVNFLFLRLLNVHINNNLRLFYTGFK